MAIEQVGINTLELTNPQGHAIGFVKTWAECDAVVEAIGNAGLDSKIFALAGDEGHDQLDQFLSGSLWGETAEDALKEGLVEIREGRIALIIETVDRDQALLIAKIAKNKGGYGFSHFGLLTDERLTR